MYATSKSSKKSLLLPHYSCFNQLSRRLWKCCWYFSSYFEHNRLKNKTRELKTSVTITCKFLWMSHLLIVRQMNKLYLLTLKVAFTSQNLFVRNKGFWKIVFKICNVSKKFSSLKNCLFAFTFLKCCFKQSCSVN